MASNIIYNREKLGRIVSFQGLPHVGTCSPSDIDICIEVGDLKKYLIGDIKENGKELETGQITLLERHCRAFESIGYTAIAFLAWHPSEIKEIDAAQSIAVRCYWKKEWNDGFSREPLFVIYCRFFGISI